jgi:hypothetical protein
MSASRVSSFSAARSGGFAGGSVNQRGVTARVGKSAGQPVSAPSAPSCRNLSQGRYSGGSLAPKQARQQGGATSLPVHDSSSKANVRRLTSAGRHPPINFPAPPISLNPSLDRAGDSATIELAPTGRVLADGMQVPRCAPYAEDTQVVYQPQAYAQLIRPHGGSRHGVRPQDRTTIQHAS